MARSGRTGQPYREFDVTKRIALFALLLAALMGGGYWYTHRAGGADAQTAKAAAPAGPRALPVVIRTVEQRAVPERLGTIGSVQPVAAIAIKARVDSVVETVHFTEGQEVKAGDLLFTLDSRALEAQLRQAQANLERDRANLDKARGDVKRYEQLVRSNTVARQQYDAAVAAADALEATVKAGQAADRGGQGLAQLHPHRRPHGRAHRCGERQARHHGPRGGRHAAGHADPAPPDHRRLQRAGTPPADHPRGDGDEQAVGHRRHSRRRRAARRGRPEFRGQPSRPADRHDPGEGPVRKRRHAAVARPVRRRCSDPAGRATGPDAAGGGGADRSAGPFRLCGQARRHRGDPQRHRGTQPGGHRRHRRRGAGR
ncbi:protein of unknown function (plasmid) [Azospirillum baldaniorum]|uniref:Multidrug resistance protein MdtA-like alpha-helical hairpin domain-containing protein n=1 Tax=Azospirillum baldaniorum TaxID=1064539 RepID=A0A9P1JTN6_9PROT|nr:protein of unknown function [Azospirillum baldaniorum]